MADFSLPHLYLCPLWLLRRCNFAEIFGVSKLESPG